MSLDLLEELDTAPPVAANLDNIDDLVRVVAREVAQAIEGMKGSAVLFENAWRHIVLEVARGHTTEIQGMRPRLLSAFEKRCNLLRQTQTLAECLRSLGRPDVPAPDLLLPELTGLERLKTSVFDQWQTPDDLEELAARDYPLTSADLDRIGPSRRPPASYYAESSKPF